MVLRRKAVFQPDILEWISTQKTPLTYLRNERRKLEKGIVGYCKDFVEFIRETRKPKGKEDTDALSEKKDSASKAMDQFYEAEDLTKRMKWKRVTWDEDADYSMFSKRILENDSLFKHTPAFSFMSIHVVRDPLMTKDVDFPPAQKVIEEGSLTKWLLEERQAQPMGVYPINRNVERRKAFSVDWSSGNVKILDTASAQEILTFLSTVAPRLQALQLKMEEQQTRQVADLEKVRVRVGAVVKFNQLDATFWDDPKRSTDPNYVTPDDVEQFLKGMLCSAFLYRWFLKGQQIRIVPPGMPYFADLEKKEVNVPANFTDYDWLGAHARFSAIESVFNSFRRFWWFWFSLSIVLIGDAELL